MAENKKTVDDEWKQQVEKEKAQAKENNQTYHEPSFTIFVSSLVMQAMIYMGKLDNPTGQKIERNDEQAKFLIDTLAILKEKTKGNLTSEEEKFLDESLFNLRMLYIENKNKIQKTEEKND